MKRFDSLTMRGFTTLPMSIKIHFADPASLVPFLPNMAKTASSMQAHLANNKPSFGPDRSTLSI